MTSSGHAPAAPARYSPRAPGEQYDWEPRWAMLLTEDNWHSVILFMAANCVHATWDAGPGRLSFGGRLGKYCVPPGWWIMLERSGSPAATAFSDEEFQATWKPWR